MLREVFGHSRVDDLVYPHEDALAIEHLFVRLREFLDSKAATISGN